MKKEQKWLRVAPNIVNYIEWGESGLDLHYATNKPVALYLGDRVLYRRKEKMKVIRNAWSLNPGQLMKLSNELHLYLENEQRDKSEPFHFTVKEETLTFPYVDALFLKEDVDAILPLLQKKMVQELCDNTTSPKPLVS